jgi:pyruvate,water dikinase
MDSYVLRLEQIDRTQIGLVGGKAASLAELTHIDGVHVPTGICITTAASQRTIAQAVSRTGVIDRLSRINPSDHEAIRELSVVLHHAVEAAPIPDDVVYAITQSLNELGEQTACAVRSSATAEDSATASFAGQQDTYLNVRGAEALLRHVSRCWASLFTDRAIAYRMRNAIDHRSVGIAVVVQRMVQPYAAGVAFTADPVTGNRRAVIVEAIYGLGEAFVSGTVDADRYEVRGREIVARNIARKRTRVDAAAAGGTESRAVHADLQDRPVLTEPQILSLAELSRRIETHFGRPQDIEWCLVDDAFQIVQSRPITTLFPVPNVTDGDRHVYVSVGHAQMMTDAMKPLGISFWQLTAGRPMYEAGGRLFVDATKELAAPASRAALLDLFGRSDPLLRDALQTLIERGDYATADASADAPVPTATKAPLLVADPAVVDGLIERSNAALATLQADIAAMTGVALIDFIQRDMQETRRLLFDPASHQVIMSGMEAAWWLNDRMDEWLGEKNAVDALSQSVPHNVTSEMGLALLDVADVVREHPEVVGFLQHAGGDAFLDDMPSVAGGAEARAAIVGWLERYGMRCAGEIDITRPRWTERPSTIIPMILANVRDFEPGEAARRFAAGVQQASSKTAELLERVRALPDGDRKAEETRSMIDRVRTFSGYREFPKFALIKRYFVYRQRLLQKAERLTDAGVLRRSEDIFYLTMPELHDVVRTSHVDQQMIQRRREDFEWFTTLTPPRVLTSDGEMMSGAYRRDDVPADALIGLPVSSGTVEGRARVVLDAATANLEPGDILVTRWTDPSWTPLFVSIRGLITEVGGLMTHGAVIAREYGLPAVVAVPHATQLIRDRDRIRLNGTTGLITLLR